MMKQTFPARDGLAADLGEHLSVVVLPVRARKRMPIKSKPQRANWILHSGPTRGPLISGKFHPCGSRTALKSRPEQALSVGLGRITLLPNVTFQQRDHVHHPRRHHEGGARTLGGKFRHLPKFVPYVVPLKYHAPLIFAQVKYLTVFGSA